jgi:polysaccharide export outer membrane protein
MNSLKKLTAILTWYALCAGGHAQEVRKAEAVPHDPASAMHKLRAGDSVEIRIFRHDELSVRGPIGADGTVALQFIGSVSLAGLTPGQARARIESLYADGWLKKPQASVNVVEYARATITVSGQVNRPGTFTLPRNRNMTLLEAIGAAGHFNTRANQRTVLLKRGDRTWEVNVKNILKHPRTDVPLRDGDIIWVKEAIF